MAVAAVTVAVLLSACTQAPAPDDTPTSAAPTSSSIPTTTPTPTTPPAPTLQPEGSADDNLPYFLLVTQQVWVGPDRVAGRAYIDALAAAGFDKGRMQVTRDQTAIGNAADSIQFSVAWMDQCLIGQAGPAFAEPVAVVLPMLEGGSCLIGDTRPIDW